MVHATLKMNGQEFVLVPKAEFRKFQRLTEQDQQDSDLASATLEKWRDGKLRTISHAQLKRKLGCGSHR
ncbi:MAG: hypothetical protein FWD61_14395 [Phycisphaerales bacterium]|nr:hypothetical protein [Phycisphaerales bacterium]